MGGSLGRLLSIAGHDVMFSGASDPTRLSKLAERVGGRWGAVADAAGFGEVVVLSVHWADVPDAVRAAGDLAGRVVLSTVNALAPDLSGLAIGHTTSAAEQIAALVPDAHVVEAFTSVFADFLDGGPRTVDGGRPATVTYAGDDAAAKDIVGGLITDIGFEPVDAGPLRNARYLEPAGFLLVQLAYRLGHGPTLNARISRRDLEGSHS